MKYTGGEAMVEVLKGQKVNAIFCSPGTEWGPVWEALARLHGEGHDEPRYFNCRHELLAATAAIGYAQKGEGMAAILLHTAGGVLNCAMSIHGAYLEQVPMLVFAGESARFTEGEDLERGRGYQWLHLSDVGGPSRIAAPFVKWSQAVTSRETLAGTVARACEIARMAPQGPVCVSIPKEYLQEVLEEDIPRFPTLQSYCPPRPDDIERIAALLVDSHKPILITERAGAQPQAVQKLVELAESLAIPVFESMWGEAINFPKEHPLHGGFDVTQAIREADVILVVAALHPWNPQRTSPPPKTKVLFIDNQAPYQQYPFWNYRADVIVAADVVLALEALVERVKAKKGASAARFDCLQKWNGTQNQSPALWDRHAQQFRDKKPIDAHWLCHAINEWLPPDAIVVMEIITPMIVAARLIRRLKLGNLCKGNYRGLGAGMGVALGIKLTSPHQHVVHLVGDGSFNYAPVLAGFGFAQEYHVPVLTVIFNNRSYGAMKNVHLSLYPDGWASRTGRFYGVDIAPSPDYVQVMRAFDGYGERVEDPDEIVPALGRAWAELEKGRSALLDIIMDIEDPGDRL